ncbi:MAG TPA: PP2C family protein-serine/threonine phosphatase [Candidatus Binatia bacterium]|nr:PP2C family protein-serine/threonine phosphatase [Candidatus Binatia bacterium]
MSILSVTSKKRSVLWRRVFQIELTVVFTGLVVYALLASINQRASLFVIMIASLTVGNLIVPLQFACRRLYVACPFPWNWVAFLPVQIMFGVICAVSAILFLQLTKIDREPFSFLFARIGYFVIVVAVVTNVVLFGVEEFQRKLRKRNQQLEQTVEKGTIALQEQEEELKRAREIQQMLLPSSLPQLAGVQIAGAWQPAREVGGDYFDVIQLDKDRLGICMGDVAGKGITAALLMANLQASFRAFATTEASPQVVCTKLNKFLCANVASGKFVTFFYAVLDADARTLTYENAGHSPGLLLRSNGTAETLRGGGAVLGALPHWTYQDYTAQLQPGDQLLLSTDGITEAENAKLEEFGEERLLAAARARDGSALETQRAIMQQVTAFCGGNFRDDATLLVLRIS